MAETNRINSARRSTDDFGMPKKHLLFLLPAIGLFIGACSSATSDSSTRDDDGVVIEGGDVGVLALNIGDCFDDPPGVLDSEDGVEIDTVAAIPCDEPHDNQAYAKFDLPESDWPGDAEVNDAGANGCLDRFESIVGEPYETSPLDIFPITPTEPAWDTGDREILCSVYNVDLSKLTSDVLSPGA